MFYDSESFDRGIRVTIRALFLWILLWIHRRSHRINPIKIIGSQTNNYALGLYFVYDSKKSRLNYHSRTSGSAPEPIMSTYLITKANFVACHQFSFLERMDVPSRRPPAPSFLLNGPFNPDEIWGPPAKEGAGDDPEEKLQFYVIDEHAVARAAGRHGGSRINTIMLADLLLRHQRQAPRRSHRSRSRRQSRRPTA